MTTARKSGPTDPAKFIPADQMNFEQRPEYGPIRLAGGESGDFIFPEPKI